MPDFSLTISYSPPSKRAFLQVIIGLLPYLKNIFYNFVTNISLQMSIKGDRQERVTAGMEQDREEDLYYVRKFKNGDPSVFNILVRKYSRRIFNTIFRMVQNGEEADDLTQDTFIQVYKALPSFREESAFYTWVYRIAVNKTLNHLKKKNRDLKLFQHPVDERESDKENIKKEIADFTNSPETRAQQTELWQVIERAVKGLSEAYRVVFVLREIEGLSYTDIAEMLSTTEQAVRVRLHRARKDLQDALKQYIV